MPDCRRLLFLPVFLLLSACSPQPQAAIDPQLAAEIANIKAIDNHAHPVLAAEGDREFDALPVDNMEPQSDPVSLRPGAFHTPFTAASKSAAKQQHGAQYPAWVLDQAGVDVMLANRVAMGPSIQPPRFRWVPYADALIFPLDNSLLAAKNSDRKAFFALEDKLRARYLTESGLQNPPPTLAEYVARVVTPTLERHKQGGAIAEKFEAAYLRSLAFDSVDAAQADRVYRQRTPSVADYKLLQDYLFRYIAAECGRLGMAVHLHTMAGAGSYFDIAGANPLNLESLYNDPALRKTNIVMVHGGWPFTREINAMLQKPNAYLDFSSQSLLLSPATLAGIMREWLEHVPEKVMFATDAYPYSAEFGWEEGAWVGANRGREALGRALTAMLRDGEITHQRAVELAHMVLRDNAKKLYGI
jgi:predicted TIM-barrel fold metal-dependent hydrolase